VLQKSSPEPPAQWASPSTSKTPIKLVGGVSFPTNHEL
jgi:hypothetical protein